MLTGPNIVTMLEARVDCYVILQSWLNSYHTQLISKRMVESMKFINDLRRRKKTIHATKMISLFVSTRLSKIPNGKNAILYQVTTVSQFFSAFVFLETHLVKM